jgi:hypothetical protein
MNDGLHVHVVVVEMKRALWCILLMWQSYSTFVLQLKARLAWLWPVSAFAL